MKASVITTALLSTLLSAAPAFAADCSGANWGQPDMGLYWTVREVVCNCFGSGQTSCNYDNQYVSFSFTGATPSTQLCWDSTENVINQCISNGWQIGTYIYSGTTLKIQRK
ncbi:hypothetical protein FN846DRAFT_339187 [Sphaerosporella brunnea]|uniref:Uncharacterized protein n=1 Tax=Sphaerosporella brunnea TaxID=1250544 RepID=A0A5J5EJS2_9PEZI|nr:hypothetical protein FN846DRAFT_339187 [Sphaerosporella brunnea]